MCRSSYVFLLSALCIIITLVSQTYCQELTIFTVATEANDGYLRFIKSAEKHHIPVKTLGMGDEWLGGNMDIGTGGGQKVLLLRKALEPFKNDASKIIMFSDSYDVLLLGSADEIVKRFKSFEKNIVFGAEDFCWPDETLIERYPNDGAGEKRFLNSGAFIGYAKDIYALLTFESITFNDDDQLFYTKAFLSETVQKTVGGIALDTRVNIFQNLNGAVDEVLVRYNDNDGYLYNSKFDSYPIVLHGNGPSKVSLNSLSNYLGETWSPSNGCQHCLPDVIELSAEEEYPLVLMSVFIVEPTPFIENFFKKLSNLNYPKSRIELSIYCGVEFHMHDAKTFRNEFLSVYNKTYFYGALDYKNQRDARNAAITLCQARSCDFWLSIDSIVHLDNPNVLTVLVSQNRSIISPMITQVNSLWSTFWGALGNTGYYARSDDYMEIAERTKTGIWNVPLVRDVYLIQRRVLGFMDSVFNNAPYDDVDLDFAAVARHKQIFMYVDNKEYYGHLIKTEGFPTEHMHNDLWTIFSNPTDWAERYVHPNYSASLNPDVPYTELPQPCPDVFWLPLLSARFCKDLVEEMEYFGQWSDGANSDPRLEGGYENVPTRDIHMRQVNWENEWIHFLRTYVYPLQKKVFAGYEDSPSARMNFVVRYRPDEQPILRPHHDASSYTLNIALNTPDVDYEGGGARFIRYNCSVVKTQLGWVLLHPGRVTHIHEGLRTTKGTRYIFVTFVNP